MELSPKYSRPENNWMTFFFKSRDRWIHRNYYSFVMYKCTSIICGKRRIEEGIITFWSFFMDMRFHVLNSLCEYFLEVPDFNFN